MIHGSVGYARRFDAVRRIAQLAPTAESVEALIATLDDDNLRFAWQTLRRVTGADIGFSSAAWTEWWKMEGAEALR